ncbi:MAG: DUF6465 family protein [Defluviitaleaceae bacterium]|nr:DUF6465 family protein [Defluviitaleaceae bacterium]
MKTEYIVEYGGKQTELKNLTEIVKETWKGYGNLVKDLKTADIYFKPEEGMCYYVINGELEGKFEV